MKVRPKRTAELKKKHGKLETKLTTIILVVAFTALMLIFCIVLSTAYRYYRTQEIENQRYQLDKTASQILTLQTTASNMGKQIIYDETVLQCLEMDEASSSEYLYARRKTQMKLANYSFIIDGVREIMIYTKDGRTLSSKYIKEPFRPEAHQWYQDFLKTGKKYGFSGIHSSDPSNDGYSVDVVSFIMSYYSVGNTSEELGKLIISIDLSKFQEMMDMDTPMAVGCCLFGSDGTPMISQGSLRMDYEQLMSEKEQGAVHMMGGDIFIVSTDMQDGWGLALEISNSRLILKSLRTYAYLLVIFLVIIIVLFAVLRVSIWAIVNPIRQLSEAAQAVGSGDFNTSVSIHTGDELEMLADVFNHMVLDIQNLMNESVEHEKLVRHMQIENLMLQINPHFIYNTMNSIVYMARMSGNPQISEFANAFISLLQSTLDVRDSIYNTVGQELKTVENYLYLQKYRYGDKFTFQAECSEDLMDCQILNVMLQPAVENAIFHGIAPKEGESILRISITREDNTLVIRVSDDGIGMSEETLQELMNVSHIQREGVRKIGVRNVKERIRDIYGEPYCLTIESKPGEGTTVIMTVPYIKQPIEQKEESF